MAVTSILIIVGTDSDRISLGIGVFVNISLLFFVFCIFSFPAVKVLAVINTLL